MKLGENEIVSKKPNMSRGKVVSTLLEIMKNSANDNELIKTIMREWPLTIEEIERTNIRLEDAATDQDMETLLAWAKDIMTGRTESIDVKIGKEIDEEGEIKSLKNSIAEIVKEKGREEA